MSIFPNKFRKPDVRPGRIRTSVYRFLTRRESHFSVQPRRLEKLTTRRARTFRHNIDIVADASPAREDVIPYHGGRAALTAVL